VYLLKHHNCRIKQGSKTAISVNIRALSKRLIHPQLQSVTQSVERMYWLFLNLN